MYARRVLPNKAGDSLVLSEEIKYVAILLVLVPAAPAAARVPFTSGTSSSPAMLLSWKKNKEAPSGGICLLSSVFKTGEEEEGDARGFPGRKEKERGKATGWKMKS